MGFARELGKILWFYSRRIYYSLDICLKDIWRLAEDRLWDARLGIHTCYDDKDLEERALFKDEVIYRPTSYHRIRKMLEYLRPGPEDVLVDYGSGKGRVVAMAVRERLKKVIGVELKRSLCGTARRNLERLKGKQTPAEVVCMDTVDFNPDEATVIFLYDPLKYRTFIRVIDNIRENLLSRPRKIRIAYFDERYAEILDAQEWLKREGEIGHTRIFVWTSKKVPG